MPLYLELLEDRSLLHGFTVTNVSDNLDPGSLRWAINSSNNDSDPSSTIGFDLPTNAPTVIALSSALPTITHRVSIDGYSQAGASQNTRVTGNNAVLKVEVEGIGISGIAFDGLTIAANHCTVQGLVLYGFVNAINIDGGSNLIDRGNDNVIQGNYIGTNAFGTGAGALGPQQQLEGVLVHHGAQRNTIGGVTPAARNVISGNAGDGIGFFDPQTTKNVVAGNFIGINAAGTAAIGNATGVHITNGASGNDIGSETAIAFNVISGNGTGVLISGQSVSGNRVFNSAIGTDVTVTKAVPNVTGIKIEQRATGNIIGEYISSNPRIGRNVVSGNSTDGIVLVGSGTSGNIVHGNFIGLDVTGLAPLPNQNGVKIIGKASGNTIGGIVGVGSSSAYFGNYISGNREIGVIISDAGTTDNLVQTNWIGPDFDGNASSPNNLYGVLIQHGAASNQVGGTILFGSTSVPAGNVISNNNVSGIRISDPGTSQNTIAGNLIGTDITGNGPMPNATGIEILNGASGNFIGAADGRNTISGNFSQGILLSDSGTSGNIVRGNFIGTNNGGTLAVPNGQGVVILAGASENTIGGIIPSGNSGAYFGNFISGNSANGVLISGFFTRSNQVASNFIGLDVNGKVALPNGGDGVLIQDLASRNTIGGFLTFNSVSVPAGNVISGNGANGIHYATHGNPLDHVVQGNKIGTNADGTAAVPNQEDGVLVEAGTDDVLIGGTSDGAGNLISGNIQNGVHITGMFGSFPTERVIVQGNKIGTNSAGTTAIPNHHGVVIDSGAVSNKIGGTDPSAGNLISGNVVGIEVLGSDANTTDTITTDNRIQGNRIGTDVSGLAALENSIGVYIFDSPANTVGGTLLHAGNTIAFNRDVGVWVNGNNAVGNAILSNSIYHNGDNLGGEFGRDRVEPGILLQGSLQTNNGPGPHTGPNHLQNYPILVSAVGHADGTTTLRGLFNSTPNSLFRIELFASPAPDPSGFGQGQTFLDAVGVTTDSNGNADFTALLGSLPAGTSLTATATDMLLNRNDTSRFSNDIEVINHIPVLDSLSPTSVVEGPFALTVNGSNFANNAVVLLNGVPLATTFVSATQLQAAVPRALVDEDLTENVTVSNPGPEGGASSARNFTVSDAPLTISPIPEGATVGMTFTDSLARFSDAGGLESLDLYRAIVTWGDGTVSDGVVRFLDGTNAIVSGTHSYSREGVYTFSVFVRDDGGQSATTSPASITIVDAPLNGVAKTLSFTEGTPASLVVATFHDGDPLGAPGDFTAAINWGDGSSSPGVITANGDAFDVTGTHAYSQRGSNPVIVTILDTAGTAILGPGGGAALTVNSKAEVSPPPLAVLAINLSVTGNKKFSGNIATFSDPDPRVNPAAFVATVTWDNGTTSSTANGTLTISGSNPFTVTVPKNAAHTFAAFSGTHTISVVVQDAPGGQGRSGTAVDRVVDPPGAGSGKSIAKVTGSGHLDKPVQSVEGSQYVDAVHVSARLDADGRAQGSMSWTTTSTDANPSAGGHVRAGDTWHMSVDTLLVSGNTAHIEGVVVKAKNSGVIGERVSWDIVDNGKGHNDLLDGALLKSGNFAVKGKGASGQDLINQAALADQVFTQTGNQQAALWLAEELESTLPGGKRRM